MSDIGDYFSQQNEIVELKAEVKMLRRKVKTEQMLKSKYKVRWQKIRDKYMPPVLTRSDKAMILIEQKHKGTLKITLKQISKQCFVTYNHACNLSYKYLKGLK